MTTVLIAFGILLKSFIFFIFLWLYKYSLEVIFAL